MADGQVSWSDKCQVGQMSVGQTSVGQKSRHQKEPKKLKHFFLKSLAEDWDNVGLLIEPSKSKIVRKIALCNDLTIDVINECVEAKTDLIIAYHPPIFRPLKRLTWSSWKVTYSICFKCFM